MNKTRHLLPLCLCASLAVHLAVLLYMPATPPAPHSQLPGNAGLQLTLTRASAGTPPPPATPATERPAPSNRPLRKHIPEAPAKPLHHRQETTNTAESATAADSTLQTDPVALPETRTTAGSALTAQLHDAMLPYFHYPLLARRRGWEGTVRVGLRISADGKISQLRIVETSHHAVLDEAAIECLRKVRQMPGTLAWMDGRDSDIVLPVEYRLTDS